VQDRALHHDPVCQALMLKNSGPSGGIFNLAGQRQTRSPGQRAS
jgi:hypothetical protein